jgi:hypothetical protein
MATTCILHEKGSPLCLCPGRGFRRPYIQREQQAELGPRVAFFSVRDPSRDRRAGGLGLHHAGLSAVGFGVRRDTDDLLHAIGSPRMKALTRGIDHLLPRKLAPI